MNENKLCNSCSSKNDIDSIYCKKCGKKLSKKQSFFGEKKSVLLVIIVLSVLITLTIAITPYLINDAKYKEAKISFDNKKYLESYSKYIELGNYKDSKVMSKESYYLLSQELIEKEKYDEAIKYFLIIKVNLTLNINEVPNKDSANEMWHIIFGLINEELIKEGIVAKPISYNDQGRYLKCIYIED